MSPSDPASNTKSPEAPWRLTRRSLIASAGAGALAFAAGARLGGSARQALLEADTEAEQQHFVSRPDLTPPLVGIDQPPPAQMTGLTAPQGLIFLAPYSGPPQWGTMIIDGSGDLVWFRPVGAEPLKAANLRVQQYRGKPVLTWWEGHETSLGYGLGEYFLFDTSYKQVARVQAANGLHGDHHEFLLTPQGTALFTIFRETYTDLSSVGGPTHGGLLESVIQEIEVNTGKLLMQWNSLDHVPIGESYRSYYGPFWDYMHANSIALDYDGNLLVSARNMHAIYKLHRRTGQIIWHLGGKKSDFTLTRGASFTWQHDFVRVGNGRYSVFNNASNGVSSSASQSSGLMLEVDEQRRLVTLLHEYRHSPPLLCTSQGSMQVLENGEVFVGWGSEPNFTQYTVHGESVFDASLPANADSYRAYRVPWSASPAEAPRLAAHASGGGLVVYASWNGSTEVATWTVLAGSSANSLKPVASAQRTGFETTIALAGGASYVAVQAIGKGGEVLASSTAIRPTGA